MPAASKPQQYVLLPSQGLRAERGTASPAMREFLTELTGLSEEIGMTAMSVRHVSEPPVGGGPHAPTPPRAASPNMELKILDSVHPDGAKLIEISPDSLATLRAMQPGVRIIPVSYYRTAAAPRLLPTTRPVAAANATQLLLKVLAKGTGEPVAGALVVAFTRFAERIGVQGVSNKKGEVRLALGTLSAKVERLYVYPDVGYWSLLQKNAKLASGQAIQLRKIDLGYRDGLRFFYGGGDEAVGVGVTVGVVDTGVATDHPDLKVAGGANTVTGEVEADFGDNGHGHGTHVAGIIAARGSPPSGLRGLAPGVALRSYRVFGKGKERASNFSIAKAIDRAVEDGCDLVNLSLGGGAPDEVLKAAIEDARANGALVIIAAGNEDRNPVSFPATDSLAIAVSAMGRKGTFPQESTEAGEVAKPYGIDKKNFIAAFSNIGPDVDLTAPGVGILSTFPGGYTAMSGTSMACPAVTGMAARLLTGRLDILGQPPGAARSEAMARVLLGAAATLGFGPLFEGQGMVRPNG